MVRVIRWTNLPLNRHTRTCNKHSSTKREDVCILTKFHRWLCQATTEAWETTGESLENIDSQVWAMSLSQFRYYWFTRRDRASVHLRFPWGPCMALRGSPTFPFLLGRYPLALRPKSPGKVGGLACMERQFQGSLRKRWWTFRQRRGKTFVYPHEVPSLTLPRNNRSLENNWRKPRR